MAEIKTNTPVSALTLEDGDNSVTVVAHASAEYGLDPSDKSDPVNVNVGDCQFATRSDGTLLVSGRGTMTNAKFIVPSMHGGKRVTGIAQNAFKGDTILTELIIPTSLEYIGGYAFANSSVQTITFKDDGTKVIFFQTPDSTWGTPYVSYHYGTMESKGYTMMQLADASRRIYGILVPMGANTIRFRNQFETCETNSYAGLGLTLEKCLFTASKVIGTTEYQLFVEEHTDIAGLTIPNGLEINSYAFKGCKNLTSVELPNRLSGLAVEAFAECENLATVTFGSEHRLTEIGSGAFKGCTSLETVVMYNGVQKIGQDAFNGCTVLSDCTLGEGLKTIGAMAFYECYCLERITIPDSVTKIEPKAFAGYGNTDSRWIVFDDAYTWVATVYPEIPADPTENVVVFKPTELIPKNESDNTTRLSNGLRLTHTHANGYWHKLKKMVKPTVSLNDTTLSMSDPLGVAEWFYVYVGDEEEPNLKVRVPK